MLRSFQILRKLGVVYRFHKELHRWRCIFQRGLRGGLGKVVVSRTSPFRRQTAVEAC